MIELADRVAESLFVIVIVTAILFGIAGRVRRLPSDIASKNAKDTTEITDPPGLGLLADDEPTTEPHSRLWRVSARRAVTVIRLGQTAS